MILLQHHPMGCILLKNNIKIEGDFVTKQLTWFIWWAIAKKKGGAVVIIVCSVIRPFNEASGDLGQV